MSTHFFSLVTGASSGIGESFARALAARGRNVVLVARSKGKLETLANELGSAHGKEAIPLPFDLSTAGAAAGLAQALGERGLRVDLLINNAAFGGRGEFWRLPLDAQARMLRLNIQTLVELTHLLLPPMVAERRGAIINVSSMTSFQPVPFATLYAASKAFVTSFSMGLAEELRPYGVKVVTLCPGGTRTNFVTIGEPVKVRQFPGGRQPPEEVAREALQKIDRGGLVVPRFVNKFSVAIQRLIPRALVPKIVAKLQRP